MGYVEKSEDVRRYWKYLNSLDSSRRLHAQLLGVTEDGVEKLGQVRPRGMIELLHPFKLYQLPSCLRATASSTDWLKFRVRGGQVLGVDATGTDAAPNPDIEVFPDVTDITVPANTSEYWFWLTVTDGVGAVTHGASPAAAGWDGFPEPDSEHIPIGVVDTATYLIQCMPLVRQFLRSDVVSVGSGDGSGSSGRGTLVSMAGDYLVVRPPGGASDGSQDIKVAKPYKLRWAVTGATIDSVAITYGSWDLTTQRRTATAPGPVTERQVITPRYLGGDPIHYVRTTTGVTDAGVDLMRLDLNVDARAWAKVATA